MLQLFRKNLPIAHLLLIPYALLLHVYAFFEPNLPSVRPENWIFHTLFSSFASNVVLNISITIVIKLFHVFLINNLILRHRMLSEYQLVPGLIYLLLCSLNPSWLYITPALLANTFIIFGLYNIFKIYQLKSCPKYFFNFGLYTAIASLIYMPSIMMLLVCIPILLVFRSLNLKELFQMIIGAFVCYFLTYIILYYNYSHLDFYVHQVLGFFSRYIVQFEWSQKSYIAFLIIMLLILVCVLQYSTFQHKRSIQLQKYFDLFFWFILCVINTLLFMKCFEFDRLMLMFPALSVLLSVLLTQFKNVMISEAIHLGFVLLILFLHFQNMLI